MLRPSVSLRRTGHWFLAHDPARPLPKRTGMLASVLLKPLNFEVFPTSLESNQIIAYASQVSIDKGMLASFSIALFLLGDSAMNLL